MTSYPDVSLLHVSTAFREIFFFFQTRKKSAFCLKLTYTLFEKMYEVQNDTCAWTPNSVWTLYRCAAYSALSV